MIRKITVRPHNQKALLIKIKTPVNWFKKLFWMMANKNKWILLLGQIYSIHSQMFQNKLPHISLILKVIQCLAKNKLKIINRFKNKESFKKIKRQCHSIKKINISMRSKNINLWKIKKWMLKVWKVVLKTNLAVRKMLR